MRNHIVAFASVCLLLAIASPASAGMTEEEYARVFREASTSARVVRVVDANGAPVPGARVRFDGFMVNEQPWSSYGWPTYDEVETDDSGLARIPYPQVVPQASETLTLNKLRVSVHHQHYPGLGMVYVPISDQAFEIKLLPRAGLSIATRTAEGKSPDIIRVEAWQRVLDSVEPESWELKGGTATADCLSTASIRFVTFGTVPGDDALWFSNFEETDLVEGDGNTKVVELRRGAPLRGRIGDDVPRPVPAGGVVNATFFPEGQQAPEVGSCHRRLPICWYDTAPIEVDGTFVFMDAPPSGTVDLLAALPGWVSRTEIDADRFDAWTIQRRAFTPESRDLQLPMEAAASILLTVRDASGAPIEGADVATACHLSTAEGSGHFRVANAPSLREYLLKPAEEAGAEAAGSVQYPVDTAVTDATGQATLSNLPASDYFVSVKHPTLPLQVFPAGGDFGRPGLRPKPGERIEVEAVLER